MGRQIYGASAEVRERKVEALHFFVMTMAALQLAFLYSFATKLSLYLEKVSRGSHEMINTYSEVKFTK